MLSCSSPGIADAVEMGLSGLPSLDPYEDIDPLDDNEPIDEYPVRNLAAGQMYITEATDDESDIDDDRNAFDAFQWNPKLFLSALIILGLEVGHHI